MITVESVYQARRDAQAKALDERREKIYRLHPKLEELNRKINLKHLELAKSKSFGEQKQTDLLAVELKELQSERERYFKDYGIDPEDLRMKYFCPLCRDRGYLSDDGYSKCSCMLKVQESLRRGQTHLSQRIEHENFRHFNWSLFDDTKRYEPIPGSNIFRTERENILIIRQAAERFIRDFDKEETKSLLFYGDAGLGKSFMCSAIAKELVDRGKTVLYFTMNELIDMMQLYHFNRDLFMQRYSMEDYFAPERVDLLILDDLGTEITNSFVKSVLFNIINARMINRKKMVISSNLDQDEIAERYEERISSRLLEYMDDYEFFGESKRV